MRIYFSIGPPVFKAPPVPALPPQCLRREYTAYIIDDWWALYDYVPRII